MTYGRETAVHRALNQRKNEFTNLQPCRVLCVTWNVNGQLPTGICYYLLCSFMTCMPHSDKFLTDVFIAIFHEQLQSLPNNCTSSLFSNLSKTKHPSEDLETLLSVDDRPADVICVGFQELDLSPETLLLMNDSSKELVSRRYHGYYS